MIDLSLTSLRNKARWVAVRAVFEGSDMRCDHSTLHIGDLIMRAPAAHSITAWSSEDAALQLLVGRDITVEELYPQLWNGDWSWQ